MLKSRPMPRAPKATLKVYANPYAALDHESRPAGAVLLDPVDHHPYAEDGEMRKFVGATMIFEEIEKPSRYSSGKYEHGFDFGDAPTVVELPNTEYYRQHIGTGDLVAADAATWKLAGFDPVRQPFVDPLKRLADAKAAAIGRHERNHGADKVLDESRAHWSAHLPSVGAAAAVPTQVAVAEHPVMAEHDMGASHADDHHEQADAHGSGQ